MTVLAPSLFPKPTRVRLADLTSFAAVRADDGLHLRLSSGAQLLVTGETGAETPLAVVLPIDAHVATRWRTAASALGLEVTLDPLTPWQRERHARALQAFDARAAGASEREVTELVFGRRDLPQGAAWKADEMRAQTLRLLASARAYVRGAYVNLLKLRPPTRRR